MEASTFFNELERIKSLVSYDMEKSCVTDGECRFRLRGAMLILLLDLSGSVCMASSAPCWSGT